MTFAPVQQGDNGAGSIASGASWNLPANVTPGDLIVLFVTTLDKTAVSAVSGLGASWTIGVQALSANGSVQVCSCVAGSASKAITVTTTGGGNYIAQASEWPTGTTIASTTSATGTSTAPPPASRRRTGIGRS